MSKEQFPRTYQTAAELQEAFRAFKEAMQAEVGDTDEMGGAPTVLLTIHDPVRGGTQFSLAGNSAQAAQSLAVVLTAPQHAELKEQLLNQLLLLSLEAYD